MSYDAIYGGAITIVCTGVILFFIKHVYNRQDKIDEKMNGFMKDVRMADDCNIMRGQVVSSCQENHNRIRTAIETQSEKMVMVCKSMSDLEKELAYSRGKEAGARRG